MRTVTFGVGCSLDGFIARADHGADWLTWGPEVQEATSAYWKTIDTVVMGRKTYDVGPREAYPDVRNVVFSRTLDPGLRGRVEVVGSDPGAFVRELKGRAGKGICVLGGGEVAARLFGAGVIDDVVLNVHPVLPGSGIPLVHAAAGQVDLERTGCTPFANGCVLLRYRVRR